MSRLDSIVDRVVANGVNGNTRRTRMQGSAKQCDFENIHCQIWPIFVTLIFSWEQCRWEVWKRLLEK